MTAAIFNINGCKIISVYFKMINLSKKASKHFKVNWNDMNFHEGDSWRIDILTIYRKRYLLVVHEKTLYTFLLWAPAVKTIDNLIQQIRENCKWYDYDPENIFIGKGENKKVTGSITDLKKLIKYWQWDDLPIAKMLDLINDTPFSMLKYSDPYAAVKNYIKEKMKYNNPVDLNEYRR